MSATAACPGCGRELSVGRCRRVRRHGAQAEKKARERKREEGKRVWDVLLKERLRERGSTSRRKGEGEWVKEGVRGTGSEGSTDRNERIETFSPQAG